jgi:hypothetical protein
LSRKQVHAEVIESGGGTSGTILPRSPRGERSDPIEHGLPMHTTELCPKCNAEFPASKHLVSHGMRVGDSWFSRKGPEVRCPNCWHVSEAQHLRLFGILPSHAVRWVVLGILAVCVLISVLQKRQGL